MPKGKRYPKTLKQLVCSWRKDGRSIKELQDMIEVIRKEKIPAVTLYKWIQEDKEKREKKPPKRAKSIEIASRLTPEEESFEICKSYICAANNVKEEAQKVEYLETARSVVAPYPEHLYTVAKEFLEIGKLIEADKTAVLAYEAYKNEPESYSGSYPAMLKFAQLKRVLKICLRTGNEAEAYDNLRMELNRRALIDEEKYEQLLQEAMLVFPNHIHLVNRYSNLLIKRGNLNDAEKLLEDYFKNVQPEELSRKERMVFFTTRNKLTHIKEGIAHKSRKRAHKYDEAKASAEETIKQNPYDVLARCHLLYISMLQKDFAKAEEYLEQLKTLDTMEYRKTIEGLERELTYQEVQAEGGSIEAVLKNWSNINVADNKELEIIRNNIFEGKAWDVLHEAESKLRITPNSTPVIYTAVQANIATGNLGRARYIAGALKGKTGTDSVKMYQDLTKMINFGERMNRIKQNIDNKEAPQR